MNEDACEAHTADLQANRTEVHSTDAPTIHQEQQKAMASLVAELEARGITAKPMSRNAVLATNRAGDPNTAGPRGRAMNPGLNQEVVCLTHGPEHSLWWFWAWSGPTRDATPDFEPFCPADHPDHAADRITHVLAIPRTQATGP